MKSRILFSLFALVVLSACSVSKSVRDQRNLISGSWTLENIKYENNTGTFNALLFNDASAVCFEGSDWFFRDNNSTGRYTIKAGSLCEGGDRFIRWSVVERPENYKPQLQFKFIDEKFRDLDAGLGYRLEISSLTAGEMTLRSNVSVDGSPVTVVYEFIKK
jgi:hypothetical protein